MRALFVTHPGLGHFLPVVPLAWAFRAAGHEALVATTGSALAASRQAGLPAVDSALDDDVSELSRSRIQAGGLNRAVFRDPLAPESLHAVAEFGDRIVDRVLEAARQWRPDVVVQTPLHGAGSVVAHALGVPVVGHGYGLMSAGGLLHDVLVEAMRPTCERLGIDSDLLPPAANLDLCPPSMRMLGETGWPMRYVPYNGGGALPDWLLAPPSRPRVCVTLGSVVPRKGGVAVLAGVVEAVAGFDLDVVLALDEADTSALGTLPSNVRPIGWVPLSELAPTCTAMIHHGGAGTTMNALVAGLPQLVLPHDLEHDMNASGVERRGIGLTTTPEQADAATVGHLLQRILEEPGFRQAAAEVRKEIVAQPPPAALVPRLTALATAA
jgi:UDP:flavonoid glycosyltransferase YjiC (YdhE family)